MKRNGELIVKFTHRHINNARQMGETRIRPMLLLSANALPFQMICTCLLTICTNTVHGSRAKERAKKGSGRQSKEQIITNAMAAMVSVCVRALDCSSATWAGCSQAIRARNALAIVNVPPEQNKRQ